MVLAAIAASATAYTLLMPLFAGEGLAKRMKAVQSLLGSHQDAVIAQAAARDIGVHAHLAGENAFSFGLLQQRAHCEAEHARIPKGMGVQGGAANGGGERLPRLVSRRL